MRIWSSCAATTGGNNALRQRSRQQRPARAAQRRNKQADGERTDQLAPVGHQRCGAGPDAAPALRRALLPVVAAVRPRRARVRHVLRIVLEMQAVCGRPVGRHAGQLRQQRQAEQQAAATGHRRRGSGSSATVQRHGVRPGAGSEIWLRRRSSIDLVDRRWCPRRSRRCSRTVVADRVAQTGAQRRRCEPSLVQSPKARPSPPAGAPRTTTRSGGQRRAAD